MKKADLKTGPGKQTLRQLLLHYLHNNVYRSKAAAAMPIKKQIRSANPALKVIVFERVFTGIITGFLFLPIDDG